MNLIHSLKNLSVRAKPDPGLERNRKRSFRSRIPGASGAYGVSSKKKRKSAGSGPDPESRSVELARELASIKQDFRRPNPEEIYDIYEGTKLVFAKRENCLLSSSCRMKRPFREAKAQERL